MDLRQLRALIAVDEHRSFSAAARALHTVQSNVSTHVARLEKELDVVLVNRKTNELTVEGEAVVSRGRRIVGELDAIGSDMAELRDDIRGTVRLGMIGTTARWLLPSVLNFAAADYPGIELVVVDATTTSLVPQLVAGQLDAAVVQLPVDDPDVTTEVLFEEDRLIVAPSDHPWAISDRITTAQLGEHPLLVAPTGTAFRDAIDADAKVAGATIKPLAEIDGMRLLATMAFQGFGPAIVPATAAPTWLEGEWRRIHVDGLSRRSVGFARRRRTTPAAPIRVIQEILHRVITADASFQPGLHVTN